MDSSHGPVGRTGPFSLFSYGLVGAAMAYCESRLKRRADLVSRHGGMAEWLCSGLQSRGRRFDSDSRLHYRTPSPGVQKRILSSRDHSPLGPTLNCCRYSRFRLLVVAFILLASTAAALATETVNSDERERLGVGLDCQWGYQRSGEACVKVRVPANARLNAFGNDWECNQGYMKRAAECVPVNIPPDAHINNDGNDWECQQGYRRSGSICVPLAVPPNAQPGSRADDWQCDRGFRRSGSMCVPIRVPLNGRLSPRGNDWECRPGYRRIGPRCEP